MFRLMPRAPAMSALRHPLASKAATSASRSVNDQRAQVSRPFPAGQCCRHDSLARREALEVVGQISRARCLAEVAGGAGRLGGVHRRRVAAIGVDGDVLRPAPVDELTQSVKPAPTGPERVDQGDVDRPRPLVHHHQAVGQRGQHRCQAGAHQLVVPGEPDQQRAPSSRPPRRAGFTHDHWIPKGRGVSQRRVRRWPTAQFGTEHGSSRVGESG